MSLNNDLNNNAVELIDVTKDTGFIMKNPSLKETVLHLRRTKYEEF